MRRLSLGFTVLLLLSAPALALDARDRSFGQGRVGAIVKNTKPADLAKIYGVDNVQYVTVGGEGWEAPGAYIHHGTPDGLQVTFSEDGQRIASVSILGKNWVSKSGLRTGTSLAQLERMNGGPFEIQGFGADYGGRVFARGALLKPFVIYIAFIKDPDAAARKRLQGDGTFSSRHPALKSVRLGVSFIEVEF